MNELGATLTAIRDFLRQAERSFALVGGLAASTWVEPPFTRDIDLAVVVRNDEDAEGLVAQLRHRGAKLCRGACRGASHPGHPGRSAHLALLPPLRRGAELHTANHPHPTRNELIFSRP